MVKSISLTLKARQVETAQKKQCELRAFKSLRDFQGCVALSAETSQKGCRTNEKQTPLKSPKRKSPN